MNLTLGEHYQTNAKYGCWLWLGHGLGAYGGLYVGKEHLYAHRYSYELHVGPIPEGLVIDHLCRNPLCIRPSHLEAVTQLENVHRGNSMLRKTHCDYGHSLEDGYPYKRHGREYVKCKPCAIETQRRYKAQKKLVLS